MTIGQIVKLKIMPDESWEVIQQQGEQFCLMNTDEPRMAIWARDEEIVQDDGGLSDFLSSIGMKKISKNKHFDVWGG